MRGHECSLLVLGVLATCSPAIAFQSTTELGLLNIERSFFRNKLNLDTRRSLQLTCKAADVRIQMPSLVSREKMLKHLASSYFLFPWLLAPETLLPTPVNALPSLEYFTDACELDSCIFRDRREFKRAGRKIVIRQEFDKNGSRSTGSAVWEGDVVLTKYMAQELPNGYFEGKRVVELGAGTGLGGMVAVLLGAAHVDVTDGDDRVLDLARRNVEANLAPAERAAVDVAQLRWESVRAAAPAFHA